MFSFRERGFEEGRVQDGIDSPSQHSLNNGTLKGPV